MEVYSKSVASRLKQQGWGIHLKEADTKDYEFIFQIYNETRFDLQWIYNKDNDEYQEILRQQFELEDKQLFCLYPTAGRNIIMLDKIRIGRLYLLEREKDIRILEIGLLEKCRGVGIGGFLIEQIIKEASKKGKGVSLQVSWFNQRAYDFYVNHGFQVMDNLGTAYDMIHKPR